MVFLPIIANNLGKVAVAAATTLGLVGFVNRERIGRWFADEPDERSQGRLQDATGGLETAESLKNLHGQLTAELMDKLTAMNTKTMGDFRVLINEAQAEVITSIAEFEGQLDAQRSETRALGEELREAVADLARRQDAVEQFLHGKDRGRSSPCPGANTPPPPRLRPGRRRRPRSPPPTAGARATAPQGLTLARSEASTELTPPHLRPAVRRQEFLTPLRH